MADIHVLLIDDDEDDYQLTRDCLQEIQHNAPNETVYTLDWINNYEAAQRALLSNQYDVFLIDHFLGAETGLELLQSIPNDFQKPAAILLTGNESRELDLEAMNAGFSDFIPKNKLEATLLDRAIRYAITHKNHLRLMYESDERKQLFVATLTHDLKVPIVSEYQVLQLLMEGTFGPVTEDQQEVFSQMMSSNRFMYRMLDNLVSTLKTQSVELTLEKSLVDLNEMITTLSQGELTHLANDRQCCIEFIPDQSLPLVQADPMELQRVFQNLIHNAIQYNKVGGHITLRTAYTDNQCQVSIEDTGYGISPEKLEHLFQPFSSHASAFKQLGTGLGLYLCKKIISAHGGTITVDSTLGQGSCFSFTLPLESSHESSTEVSKNQLAKN